MKFDNLKFATKMALSFSLLIVCLLIIGPFSITQLISAKNTINDLYKDVIIPSAYTSNGLMLNERMRIAMRDAVRWNEPEMIEAKIQSRKNFLLEFEDNMNSFKKTIRSDKGNELFSQYLESKEAYVKAIDQIEQLALENKDEEAYKMIDKGTALVSNKFRESIQKITDNRNDETVTLISELDQKLKKINITMIVIVVAGIFISILVATLIIKKINASLQRISENLQESSAQVINASGQLSETSRSLASASSEQVSALEETSASLEETSGMINNNLQNAEHSKELAEKMKEIATQGNSSVNELIQSMQAILDANKNIEKLVSVIGEIGEKTQIIDEIVFQTKLLSFNASVEAERAGEHGRGFAVVAQEVGKLAQMSGKAALEISDIVKASVKSAEQIAKDNKMKAERGHELVKNTASILHETSLNSEAVSAEALQVVQASREQASGIRQITSAMDQLNRISQGNATAAEEMASSSGDLATQSKVMKQLVVDLNRIVLGGRAEEG